MLFYTNKKQTNTCNKKKKQLFTGWVHQQLPYMQQPPSDRGRQTLWPLLDPEGPEALVILPAWSWLSTLASPRPDPHGWLVPTGVCWAGAWGQHPALCSPAGVHEIQSTAPLISSSVYRFVLFVLFCLCFTRWFTASFRGNRLFPNKQNGYVFQRGLAQVTPTLCVCKCCSLKVMFDFILKYVHLCAINLIGPRCIQEQMFAKGDT